MTTSVEFSTCARCPIENLPDEDRRAVCVRLAKEAVREWCYGDATFPLHEAARDVLFFDEQRLSTQERTAYFDCMAEHSANTCSQFQT